MLCPQLCQSPARAIVQNCLLFDGSGKQWRGQGQPGRTQAHPNACCALPPRLQKDRDTLIEQWNILIKQSAGQVVPCQFTQSGYATAGKSSLISSDILISNLISVIWNHLNVWSEFVLKLHSKGMERWISLQTISY